MRKLLLWALMSFLFYNFASSQQSYKIFIDSTEAKLYYNRNLPVYFWISTSPNSNQGVEQLLYPKVKRFANPYYWDTEGINTFRVKYPKGGKKEAIFDIWADGRPPIPKISFKNFTYYKTTPVLGAKSNILLSAKDYISGLDKIYFILDNSAPKLYEKPISGLDSGWHVIKTFAIDKVGNISDTISRRFLVDLSAPQLQLKVLNSASDSLVSDFSLIKIIAHDPHGIKNIYYKLDYQNSYSLYTKPISVRNFPDGRHLFYYYATDRLGNQSQVFSHVFIIDRTPPSVDLKILGNFSQNQKNTYISPNTMIQILASDNSPIDQYYYSINSKRYQTKSDLIEFKHLSGPVRVCIQAKDVAGNKSNTICRKFFVDSKPPISSIKFGRPQFFDRDTLFITSKTPIELLAKDNASGVKSIQYALNNMNMLQYQQPFHVQRQGINIIYYRAVDNVGNIEPVKQQLIFVDDTPPVITITFSIEPIDVKIEQNDTIKVFPNNIKIYLAAQDDKTGERRLKYSINNSKLTYYTSTIYMSAKQETLYTLHVESYDALGNKSSKQVKFIIRP